ncbi:hypothetical protein BDZ94DRAFT_1278479 [Collybia nuda]|uniref:Uncharacterized protein n=1 Tax=Collybia nuda TaxID=64659 RepID=A0A9P5XTR7_9AGAR|nr:hypothetical protein BDZ94DRAFT_1278479 [Collybia nuda]
MYSFVLANLDQSSVMTLTVLALAFARVVVTAVRSYPLDQDLVNQFDETVDNKSDVYRLPDIKDESASRIELSVEL